MEKATRTFPKDYEGGTETPGAFMVIRKTGEKQFEAFKEFCDHKPVVGTLGEGMVFAYEGMAKHVAETLGEGWYTFDASVDAYIRTKKLLAAIFWKRSTEDEEIVEEE